MERPQPILVDVSGLKNDAIDREEAEIASAKPAKAGKRGRPSKTAAASEVAPNDIEMGISPEQKQWVKNNFELPPVQQAQQLPSPIISKAKKTISPADDFRLKNQLIRQIQGYHLNFEKDYGPYTPIDPHKATTEGLERALDNMREVRNKRNVRPMIILSYSWFAKFVEFGWQSFMWGNPLNPLRDASLFGAADHLTLPSSLKAVEEELVEFEIEYGSWFSQPLWMRFASKLSILLQEVTHNNKGMRAPHQEADAAKYADL